MSNSHSFRCLLAAAVLFTAASVLAQAPLIIERSGDHCLQDPNCINRLHPNIPMTLRAQPGQTILFATRNALDTNLDPAIQVEDDRPNAPGSSIHPLTGPVYIEGAKAGDALAVTIEKVEPGAYGFTAASDFGFAADKLLTRPYQVLWRLDERWAVSDQLPGVRIPNAGFPGIVTILPGPATTQKILAREHALLAAGGAVNPPTAINAAPAAVCGPQGSHKDECLRTFPPREHGGNLDIRYLIPGVTLYLPCELDGCGLAIGDVHYAQGDGEVSGTAIEMDARVSVTTRIVKGAGARGISYEGPAEALRIPSRRFYATVGYPFKQAGEIPPEIRYLEAHKIGPLTNLSMDISQAARNALVQMRDYLMQEYGYSTEQAYILMSVAVDLRIGQLVDAPNVTVSAILPLDIFTTQ